MKTPYEKKLLAKCQKSIIFPTLQSFLAIKSKASQTNEKIGSYLVKTLNNHDKTIRTLENLLRTNSITDTHDVIKRIIEREKNNVN